MKNVPAVADALRTRYAVQAKPKASIEWNLNRYFDLEVLNAVADSVEENDNDVFPIESIVQPWRPTKGINKARINYGTVVGGYNDWPSPRFYIGSEDDKYKYWMSPTPSDMVGNLPNCIPTVLYNEQIPMNKIKVVVENTWASPYDYSVQYTTDRGATWNNTTLVPIQNDGTIEVFWNGTTWVADRPDNLSAYTYVNGIRFVCARLTSGRLADGSVAMARTRFGMVATTGQGSYLSLIELAPCLVRDLSDLLISADDSFNAGETSIVSPVGTLSSNTGSVTLWNEDNIFSTENQDSPYRKLIEQNAEVNLSYVYDIDGTSHEVQQFRLYADNWTDNGDGTTTIEMSDASKHLSEIKPNPCRYENMKFSEIMYRLCDSVGWNRYNVDRTPRANDIRVPVFWTDGEQTLWELLDGLAQASQSIIYFDEYGYMNVKTREDAFAPDATPVWTLRGETAGNELADIESLSDAGELGSNMVKVIYKDTKWADVNNGFAENTAVWEAPDPTVLRSSPLLKTLEVGVTDPDGRERFQMSPQDAALWPHTGFVLIEGEIIEYDAKMFVYQDGGKMNYRWITSQAEHDTYNEKVQDTLRYRNYYDGQFRIKERGAWNTAVARHSVDAAGYNVQKHGSGGTSASGGFIHDKRESLVHLRTAGHVSNANEWVTATRGVAGDSPWRWIGTKMRINAAGSVHGAGGIVFNMTTGRDGYYVEICPSSQLPKADRAHKNELVFYVVKNGKRSPWFPNKGASVPVAMNGWGELEVWFSIWDQRVKVFWQGQQVWNFHVPGQWQIQPTGKFGLFARGKSDISFDYLYASSRQADPEPDSDYPAVSAVKGVMTGERFVREWIHRNTRKQRNKRKKSKKSIFDKRQRFLDDFGPYVHEFKEFDVKFDPGPVKSSFIFNTNDAASYVVDYRGNSWGAKFTVVGTERYNSVLQGEDAMGNPYGEALQQKMIIYGHGLVIGEGEEVISRNEQQIRARGEIVTEINSDWIQSRDAAQEIADWIVKHWSAGVDQLNVEVFGNPLLHVGDVVAVDYPEKDMTAATHHYFVTDVSTSFDGGIYTSLILRRRN